MFIDNTTAKTWLTTNTGYRMVHATTHWANGISYGCHPEYGDVVAALNMGLMALKVTQEYRLLCAQYPSIACEFDGTCCLYPYVQMDQ